MLGHQSVAFWRIPEYKMSRASCFAMISACEIMKTSHFTWFCGSGSPEVPRLPMISECEIIKDARLAGIVECTVINLTK